MGPPACQENWKKILKNLVLPRFSFFLAESLFHMLSAFFWGIYLFRSSKFEILVCYGLKNINIEHLYTSDSCIKNIHHLGVILLLMVKKISKCIAGNNYRYFEVVLSNLCSLKHLQVKLTLPRLITSFQTLPEIGLNTMLEFNASYVFDGKE